MGNVTETRDGNTCLLNLSATGAPALIKVFQQLCISALPRGERPSSQRRLEKGRGKVFTVRDPLGLEEPQSSLPKEHRAFLATLLRA